jgi:aryl-alcohol dehydrogenase-like predicted oxidoreductase
MRDTVSLGRTDIQVSRLGLGTGRLGECSADDAMRLLDEAWALGIRVFDTARSYGAAEADLGRWLKSRALPDVVVTTKVGYGVNGVSDWSADAVAIGIDDALQTLNVDALGVVFLHSCPGNVAVRDDVVAVLAAARAAGKVRAVGYAGENEALDITMGHGVFDVFQLSVSVVDQGSRELRLPWLHQQGRGVFAKRALGNAFWRGSSSTSSSMSTDPSIEPALSPEDEYRRRGAAMALREPVGGHAAQALRFTAFTPGVHTSLVGSRRLVSLREAVAAVAQGPLPPDEVDALVQRWHTHAAGWRGVV